MIEVKLLKKLLNTSQTDFKDIDTEQLRVILGSFRCFIRVLEREINHRTSDQFTEEICQ